MLSARTTWDVEDNWIVLKGGGLGDPVDALIKHASDKDPHVRLLAVIALGKQASADSADKRALPVMYDRLADKDSQIRMVAAAAFGITGWVDATVDPCFRNRLIATLQVLSDPKIEPDTVTRTKAAASLKLLLELGMLDSRFLPIAEKCGIVRPVDQPPDPGPLVDPNAPPPPGLSTGKKVAIAVAAAAALGALGYVLLGGENQRWHVRVRRA